MKPRPLLWLLVAAAPSAFAQNGSVAMEGAVEGRCAFDTAGARLAPAAPNNVRALAGNNLEIDTLVDPATLAVRAASVDLSFAAMCNVPHVLRFEAQNNGLFRNAGALAAPAGFANAVPYRARFGWGQETRTLIADANTRRPRETAIDRPMATAGDVVMEFEVQPGTSNLAANAPLVSGNYMETFRITLEPRQ